MTARRQNRGTVFDWAGHFVGTLPGTPATAARRIRNLADLADQMLEGEDKRHWDERNGDGKPGDPKRRCPECRTIDLAREVADGLDPPKARKGGSP